MSAIAQTMVWSVVSIFFREVDVLGAEHVPETGPVIFVCGPHANQFFDPMLTFICLSRRPRFLAAAKSMQRRFVGWMIKQFDSIPVVRPEDIAKKGSGTIVVDGLVVTGTDTKFTAEVQPGSSISLGSAMAKVDVIVSDTELKLKAPFEEELKEISKYKIVPKVDQEEMYNTVWSCLKEGNCVGIFPEGGSHDQPQLLPLKTGVAIMALGAAAKHNLKVTIVPVGLNYFAPDKFRSKAFLDVGHGLEIPDDLVKEYAAGGERKIKACNQLMDRISESLKSVTVNTPDFETFQMARMFRKLYTPHGVDLPLDKMTEITRRFVLGYEKLKDIPEVQKLVEDVKIYNERLAELNVRDHHVRRAVRINSCYALFLLMYRLLAFVVLATFALPGFILNIPIMIVADRKSKQKAAEAVASSKVKIVGKDVLASWKVLIGFVMIPLVYLAYTILSIVLAFALDVPKLWKIVIPLLMFFGLPFVSWFSIRFGEVGLQLIRSVPSLIQSIFGLGKKKMEHLYEFRKDLQKRIIAIVDRYGKQVLGDQFEEKRIVKSEEITRRLSGVNKNSDFLPVSPEKPTLEVPLLQR